jgi:hypothetical protein
MILYATKKTIKELEISMPEELSIFNSIMVNKIIKEQTNDNLLEWGLKIFYFDGRKCVQAVNFASKMAIFLFDIKNNEIQWIANGIAIYINEIYSRDKTMLNLLEKFYKDYPACAFSRLTNKSIISSLNQNQYKFADDGYRFYDYINNNILNSKQINNDFNWENLTTVTINGKKSFIYPAEYFRKLLIERYKKQNV